MFGAKAYKLSPETRSAMKGADTIKKMMKAFVSVGGVKSASYLKGSGCITIRFDDGLLLEKCYAIVESLKKEGAKVWDEEDQRLILSGQDYYYQFRINKVGAQIEDEEFRRKIQKYNDHYRMWKNARRRWYRLLKKDARYIKAMNDFKAENEEPTKEVYCCSEDPSGYLVE